MKNLYRDIDAAFSFVLKLLFVHDALYSLGMLPLEMFIYKRQSDALISSRDKNAVLMMSLNRKLTRIVKARDYQKDDAAILIILKNAFTEGLRKLDFSKQPSFTTEVNERFYLLISKELARQQGESFEVQIIEKCRRRQPGAKLLLISSTYLWKCLLQGKMQSLKSKLLREENVLKLRISKIERQASLIPHKCPLKESA